MKKDRGTEEQEEREKGAKREEKKKESFLFPPKNHGESKFG